MLKCGNIDAKKARVLSQTVRKKENGVSGGDTRITENREGRIKRKGQRLRSRGRLHNGQT